MKKIFWTLVIVALAVLFAGTLGFLWKKSQVEPTLYDSNVPFKADIVEKTVATGSVLPRQEVEIKPQVSGIVGELFIEPGQQVKEGDLIAKVNIVPNILSLSAAESRVKRAKINLENAEREFDRNQQLYEQGVISESIYLSFDLGLKNSREEIAGAEDNLAVIREGARMSAGASTNTLVRSTAEGMVLEVPVEKGDSVIEANNFNAGTTIAMVANMDEMIFEGLVDESEVGKVEEGMELVLTIGAIEKEPFTATLEYIAPKGLEEEGAIQFEIKAALQLRQDLFVRANYSANADIVLDRRDDVLSIQESWLQFGTDGPFVEVEIGDQQFENRTIKPGLSDGIVIEVLEGLTAEDRVKDPNSGHRAGESD